MNNIFPVYVNGMIIYYFIIQLKRQKIKEEGSEKKKKIQVEWEILEKKKVRQEILEKKKVI